MQIEATRRRFELFLFRDMNEDQTMKSWEEVSILVDQKLAEPVAGVLRGILPEGVVLESVFEETFPHELDLEGCPVRVYGYLPVDKSLEGRREEIRMAIQKLERFSSLPDLVFTPIQEQDWTTAWQKKYQPIPLGARLIVVPSWLKNPSPERIPVFIDPGMAFGSGTHPTTQLSLTLIEECLVELPSPQMIDVGCGSGILSIAAAKLGLSAVLGLDIDPAAIRISKENAEYNQVSTQIKFIKGSVKDLREKDIQPSQASLVVANIIAPVLGRLFEEGLEEIITPGGNLILSGILINQSPGLLALFDEYGIKLKEKRQRGEWISLWGKRANL